MRAGFTRLLGGFGRHKAAAVSSAAADAVSGASMVAELPEDAASAASAAMEAAAEAAAAEEADTLPPLKSFTPVKPVDTGFRAKDLTMSDEQRAQLMKAVRNGSLSVEDALQRVLEFEAAVPRSRRSTTPDEAKALAQATRAHQLELSKEARREVMIQVKAGIVSVEDAVDRFHELCEAAKKEGKKPSLRPVSIAVMPMTGDHSLRAKSPAPPTIAEVTAEAAAIFDEVSGSADKLQHVARAAPPKRGARRPPNRARLRQTRIAAASRSNEESWAALVGSSSTDEPPAGVGEFSKPGWSGVLSHSVIFELATPVSLTTTLSLQVLHFPFSRRRQIQMPLSHQRRLPRWTAKRLVLRMTIGWQERLLRPRRQLHLLRRLQGQRWAQHLPPKRNPRNILAQPLVQTLWRPGCRRWGCRYGPRESAGP